MRRQGRGQYALMTKKKILLLGSLGLVGFFILNGIFSESEEPVSTEESTSTTPPLDVSVSEIYQAYQENEARANVTYKGRQLNLSFTVDEIEDKYVVQDLDDIGFVTAELTFDQADLVQFNTGDFGTRICSLKGFELDLWLKFDCR